MSLTARLRRVQAIDQCLRRAYQAGGPIRYWSSQQLKQYLKDTAGEEFSARTIYRDVEWMRDQQGAPIEYDQSHHGYYYTDDSWNLPGIQLTESDLFALLVADRAIASYRNTPFYENLKQVFHRLTSALPDNVSIAANQLTSELTVMTEPVTRIPESTWQVIIDSLRSNRRVRIYYKTPSRPQAVPRKLDPLHVVAYRGEWYLIAYSHHEPDQDYRIYALARIRNILQLADKFQRPPGFRVEDHIDPSFGVYLGEEEIEVVVRFYGEAASKIPERVWHPRQKIVDNADGSITMTIPTNQQSQTLFWISQWGPDAEIVSPAEFREKARGRFEATLKRYS